MSLTGLGLEKALEELGLANELGLGEIKLGEGAEKFDKLEEFIFLCKGRT